MSRKEDFPIEYKVVDNFIKVNKKQWKNIETNDKYIYLNFSMVRMQAAWIIPKLIYAKGMQEATNAKVIVLTWRANEEVSKLIESYGFCHVPLHEIMFKNLFALVKSGLKTAGFLLFKGSGNELKRIEICNTKAGKSLYEDIIRTSSLSTIKSARNKTCIKKMIHLFWMAYALDSYVSKRKPILSIADDIAYHEGLIHRIMKKHGARVYQSNYQQERLVNIDENDNIETIAEFSHKFYVEEVKKLDDSCIKWSEDYLQERFKGNNGRAIDRGAFANKKVLSRNDFYNEYKLDPSKKTVVIMSHTFSDAVYNYGELYFRDYYDWLEKTLQLAGKIDTVNWVLKPHPTRASYNESVDSIELMFEKYKKSHMAFLDDSVSAESIINFADAQVTIGGNSGGEFSCFGIPTVIVGKPYYRGFGYTIEPKTYKEYAKVLEKMNKIKPLSDEQIVMAKKLFYLRNNESINQGLFLYKDEFGELVNKNYKAMFEKIALQYFAGNEGTEGYNTDILNKILEYGKNNKFTETEYFMRGFMRGKNL